MATYGNSSQSKLNTCHPDLIVLFQEVIKYFDNTIVYGIRTPEEQFELFKQGRFLNSLGVWAVWDKSKVVTYCDGINKKSNHNYTPSKAVDSIPYPIDWKDTNRMYYFAGFVKATALQLHQEGKIFHFIRWGGDWDNDTEVKDETFMDLAHYEIVD